MSLRSKFDAIKCKVIQAYFCNNIKLASKRLQLARKIFLSNLVKCLARNEKILLGIFLYFDLHKKKKYELLFDGKYFLFFLFFFKRIKFELILFNEKEQNF